MGGRKEGRRSRKEAKERMPERNMMNDRCGKNRMREEEIYEEKE